MKTCSKCRIEKSPSEFSKDRGKADGLCNYCKPCNRQHCRDHYNGNKSRYLDRAKTYAEANVEKTAEFQREYYRKNAAKLIARAVEQQRANPEAKRAIRERYERSRPGYKLFRKRLREARKIRACPAWADIEAIKQIYLARPPGFHVDHIVPLVAMRDGVHVASGLHIAANLQHLPAAENCRKWATMPES